MRRLLFAAALLVAGSASAAQPDYLAQATWSAQAQTPQAPVWCEGLNTTFGYDGRHDLVRPAYNGKPEMTLVLSPEVTDLPNPSYDDTDPTEIINISYAMDKRLLALSDLMDLHDACAEGGETARQRCIPLGRVEQVIDILFTDPNTGVGFGPDTYDAPRAQVPAGSSGFVWRFSEPRHLFDSRIGGAGAAVTSRQHGFRSAADAYPRKWATYGTPGPFVPCEECRETLASPGMQGDRTPWSPSQIAAAEAVLFAPLQPSEYVVLEDGIQVPHCPQAQ